MVSSKFLENRTSDSLALGLLSRIDGGFGPHTPTTLLEGKKFQAK
jgi:hypothetical protein